MVKVYIRDLDTGDDVEYLCDDFIFAGSNHHGNVDVSKTDNVTENCFLLEKLRKEVTEDI